MKGKPTWRELLIGIGAIVATIFGYQLVPTGQPSVFDEEEAATVVVDTMVADTTADSVVVDSVP